MKKRTKVIIFLLGALSFAASAYIFISGYLSYGERIQRERANEKVTTSSSQITSNKTEVSKQNSQSEITNETPKNQTNTSDTSNNSGTDSAPDPISDEEADFVDYDGVTIIDYEAGDYFGPDQIRFGEANYIAE